MGSPTSNLVRSQYLGSNHSRTVQYQQHRAYHVSKPAEAWADVEEEVDMLNPSSKGEVTLSEAILEPRQNLTQLRMAGFDELCSALEEMVETQGPVEHVCVSFLFRKVESRREVRLC